MYHSLGKELGLGCGFIGFNLSRLFYSAEIQKGLEQIVGKDVIAILNHQLDKNLEGPAGLQFKRGTFKIVSDRLDWGQMQDSFENIYDVVPVELISFRGGFNEKSPQVYTFFAGAGDEDETIKVVHIDPVMAYYFVKEKATTTRHELKSVEPLIPGAAFYWHKSFDFSRED